MCSELVKLAISFALLVKDSRQGLNKLSSSIFDALKRIAVGLSWKYAILAGLYGLQNNLVFFTLQYMDPGTFQIFGNLRIPTVAILLFFILKKSYSRQQIAGVAMLTVGAILYSAAREFTDTGTRKRVNLVVMMGSEVPVGYALSLLMILLASIAGVLNEYYLKEGFCHQSVDLQNAQLYFFGFLQNSLVLLSKQPLLRVFVGYKAITFLIVANSACFGVSVGYITRYCDNNIRSFAGIAAMLLAAMYSHLFLHSPLPTGYPASLALVCLGVLLYAQS